MSGLIEYAIRELDRIGMGTNDSTDANDDVNSRMRNHIIDIIERFSEEGHSGASAGYAINILSRLLAYKPLSPLTGEDDEWMEIGTDNDGSTIYQSTREHSVFKQNGQAYWMDGIVFWEWYSAPDIDDGKPYKVYYTSKDSRVNIDSFPWEMPDKPQYVEKSSDD